MPAIQCQHCENQGYTAEDTFTWGSPASNLPEIQGPILTTHYKNCPACNPALTPKRPSAVAFSELQFYDF